jgi:hypothetical protein
MGLNKGNPQKHSKYFSTYFLKTVLEAMTKTAETTGVTSSCRLE